MMWVDLVVSNIRNYNHVQLFPHTLPNVPFCFCCYVPFFVAFPLHVMCLDIFVESASGVCLED